MKPYNFIAGAPNAGHMYNGYFHPGNMNGCPKCPNSVQEARK